ncbi:MAG: cell division protein SepF [Syntrophomonadaceae bacterium]|jgi:cell division inhibitor SepF|nr:cell division protein SepF [Syntrophomonadaceae bacterium]MDH7498424.1 cell division protein SepF [Syntrophomonadaceae bacterium]
MGMTDKFWRLLGVDTDVDEEVLEIPMEPEHSRGRKTNLVSIHTAKTIKVVVCEPATFEEAQAIADNLKNRRQVVINLEKTQAEARQRIIDFVSGTTYALDGHTEKLGDNIFLFAPSNVEIAKEARPSVRSSSIFPRARVFGGDDA